MSEASVPALNGPTKQALKASSVRPLSFPQKSRGCPTVKGNLHATLLVRSPHSGLFPCAGPCRVANEMQKQTFILVEKRYPDPFWGDNSAWVWHHPAQELQRAHELANWATNGASARVGRSLFPAGDEG